MDRSRSVPLLVLVLCLSGAATAGATAAVASPDAGVAGAAGTAVPAVTEHPAAMASASAMAGATRAPPDPGFGAGRFDRTEFVIRVAPDGDARWTIRYMRTLTNVSDEASFRDFADRFETEETTIYTDFRETASTLVADGERLVDRPMSAENFSRTASVDENLGQRDTGVVEMSFTWTGFANVTGDRVVVGDVFEGGLYIGQNQELVVRPTADLRFDSVDPQGVHSGPTLPESDSVTWQGELSFSDNRPRVVMTTAPLPQDTATATASPTPTDDSPGATDTGSGTTEMPASGGSGGGGNATMLLVGGLLVALAGGAAVLVLRRRGPPDDGGPAAGSPPDAPGSGPDGDSGAQTGPADATAGAATASEPTDPGPPGEQAVQEEPLTDEALVIDLLKDNDGQMKQSAIVEETGWSKSKVSMVLSEMDDEGELSKLRVGRENLISLKGHEPAAARSPYEDEE